MKKLKWRRVLRVLHRDLGFLCVGLTVVYCVSGIAVNHRHDWDYNFSKTIEVHHVGAPAELLGEAFTPAPGEPPPAGELARAEQEMVVTRLTAALGRTDGPRKAFWRGSDKLSLFFGPAARDVVDYFPERGVAQHELTDERAVLYELNALHLNSPSGVWTWVADIFAVLMIFLAISGLFIVKGRSGVVGRGAIYVGLGIVIPIVALVVWR